MFVVAQLLRRCRTLAVVCAGRDHRVARAPAAVRAIVLSHTSTHDFVSFLLRFDIDRGVDRQTTLCNTSRVFVFELLTNELDWIIKRRRLSLRLIVGGVSQLNRFSFSGVSFSLTD